MKKNNVSFRIKKFIEEYIEDNIYNYILIILVFIIGIFAGIIVVNNFCDDKKEIINNYVASCFENLITINKIDQNNIFKNAFLKDLILTIILFISGTTILGMPIVLGIILYRGFCLSYTISSITLAIGCNKSIFFCLFALVLPNLFFIPAIFTIAVSSLKLYKSIMYEKNKDIIKNRLYGHFKTTIIMFLCLIFANIVESNISVLLIQMFRELIK